jgi:hypothetical protein
MHELIAQYFDPRGNYGAATFNTLAPNPADDITSSDLLALTLLSVTIRPRGVRELLDNDEATRREALAMLKVLPSTECVLWEATDEDLANAEQLWRRLRSVESIGPVVAGKLLARKRPRLIPIVDSVVADVLRWDENSYWRNFRSCLRDETLRRAIERLRRPAGVPDSVVPTVRLLDVAIWMYGTHRLSAGT